jgi:hypothetical protein
MPGVQIVVEVTRLDADTVQEACERREVGFLPTYRLIAQSFAIARQSGRFAELFRPGRDARK